MGCPWTSGIRAFPNNPRPCRLHQVFCLTLTIRYLAYILAKTICLLHRIPVRPPTRLPPNSPPLPWQIGQNALSCLGECEWSGFITEFPELSPGANGEGPTSRTCHHQLPDIAIIKKVHSSLGDLLSVQRSIESALVRGTILPLLTVPWTNSPWHLVVKICIPPTPVPQGTTRASDPHARWPMLVESIVTYPGLSQQHRDSFARDAEAVKPLEVGIRNSGSAHAASSRSARSPCPKPLGWAMTFSHQRCGCVEISKINALLRSMSRNRKIQILFTQSPGTCLLWCRDGWYDLRYGLRAGRCSEDSRCV